MSEFGETDIKENKMGKAGHQPMKGGQRKNKKCGFKATLQKN